MIVRTKSSQLWIWLGSKCSSHVRAESARCSGRFADDHRISAGATQLASQAVVVESYARIRLPSVLVDGGGLSEALGETRRANLPAEHAGFQEFQRW
jgi:hypothetical protein